MEPPTVSVVSEASATLETLPMIASMLDVGAMVMAADGSCQEAQGQGARARRWPVHDPKTQSPAEATLLKLTRLSENGLAAIGAVTPLAHAFLPRTLPGARQGEGVWRAGLPNNFPPSLHRAQTFASPSHPRPRPPVPTDSPLWAVDRRPSPQNLNQLATNITRRRLDLTKTTQQRSASRPPSCAFPFAPSFRRAQRRPVISARLLRGFS